MLTVYYKIIVYTKVTWPSVRESDSKSAKGVPCAAPSSISVLVIATTLETELSKTLLLQSLQMTGSTNKKIDTFKLNLPWNMKTNAYVWMEMVLFKWSNKVTYSIVQK